MTDSEWIEYCVEHSDNLRALVEDYHPGSKNRGYRDMKITAPLTERAVAGIRQEIAARGDPVARWDLALRERDVRTLGSLLSETWFGVPESTDCWELPGFAEACELLES